MNNKLPWEQRAVEVAHLVNPAFLAVLLRSAIGGYGTINHLGMPFSLLFLPLPIVLHKPSRDLLPTRTTTKLTNWIRSKPHVLVGYYDRARQLVPYTQEGLIYGIQAGLFIISEDGRFIQTSKKLLKGMWPNDSEPVICRNKAEFVGRWLASAGDQNTIFSIIGVQP